MNFDSMVTEARKGCCDDKRKPCTYHEGWGDALDILEQRLEAASQIDALKQGIWEMAGISGADLDGQRTYHAMTFPDIVTFGKQAVQDLRDSYDEILAEDTPDGTNFRGPNHKDVG